MQKDYNPLMVCKQCKVAKSMIYGLCGMCLRNECVICQEQAVHVHNGRLFCHECHEDHSDMDSAIAAFANAFISINKSVCKHDACNETENLTSIGFCLKHCACDFCGDTARAVLRGGKKACEYHQYCSFCDNPTAFHYEECYCLDCLKQAKDADKARGFAFCEHPTCYSPATSTGYCDQHQAEEEPTLACLGCRECGDVAVYKHRDGMFCELCMSRWKRYKRMEDCLHGGCESPATRDGLCNQHQQAEQAKALQQASSLIEYIADETSKAKERLDKFTAQNTAQKVQARAFDVRDGLDELNSFLAGLGRDQYVGAVSPSKHVIVVFYQV